MYLKMVYCKLDIVMKTVSSKVMTIENKILYYTLDVSIKMVSSKVMTIQN